MKKITIFGGDSRIQTVYYGLIDAGFTVDSFGLFEDESCDMESSDIFLLPVPTTRDSITVYAPLTGKNILLDNIAAKAENKLVLTGNHMLNTQKCIDYCKSDAYSLKNAVPTAEGAIALAVSNTPFTLWKSRALVIGYGRVGKIMAERLKGMHASVTVSARKSSDIALIQTLGFKSILTSQVPQKIQDFDIIFNTIDVPILESEMEKLYGKTVIDLSSKGCFNHDKAKQAGVNAIKAPGLPGKTAPQTAGRILTETVLELIQQNT